LLKLPLDKPTKKKKKRPALPLERRKKPTQFKIGFVASVFPFSQVWPDHRSAAMAEV